MYLPTTMSQTQPEPKIKKDTFLALTCFERILQYLNGDDIRMFRRFIESKGDSKLTQFVEEKADEAFREVTQKYNHYERTLQTLTGERREMYAKTERPRTYGCHTRIIELIESLKSNILQHPLTLVNLMAFENLLAGPREDVQFDIFRGEPIKMNEFTRSNSEGFTFYNGYDMGCGFATMSKELALINGDIIKDGTKHYISFQIKKIGAATSMYKCGVGMMRPIQNTTWDAIEGPMQRYEPRRRVDDNYFEQRLNRHRQPSWQGDRDCCLIYPNYNLDGEFYIQNKKWGHENGHTYKIPPEIGRRVEPNENKIEEYGLLCDMTNPGEGGTLSFFTNGEKVFEVQGKFEGEYVWVLQVRSRSDNTMPLRIRAKKYFSQRGDDYEDSD